MLFLEFGGEGIGGEGHGCLLLVCSECWRVEMARRGSGRSLRVDERRVALSPFTRLRLQLRLAFVHAELILSQTLDLCSHVGRDHSATAIRLNDKFRALLGSLSKEGRLSCRPFPGGIPPSARSSSRSSPAVSPSGVLSHSVLRQPSSELTLVFFLSNSDIAAKDQSLVEIQYPRTVDHELIGDITMVGPNEQKWKEGDRVGGSWPRRSLWRLRLVQEGVGLPLSASRL